MQENCEGWDMPLDPTPWDPTMPQQDDLGSGWEASQIVNPTSNQPPSLEIDHESTPVARSDNTPGYVMYRRRDKRVRNAPKRFGWS